MTKEKARGIVACIEALALLQRIANRFGMATQGTDCDTLKVRTMLEDVIRKEEAN